MRRVRTYYVVTDRNDELRGLFPKSERRSLRGAIRVARKLYPCITDAAIYRKTVVRISGDDGEGGKLLFAEFRSGQWVAIASGVFTKIARRAYRIARYYP